MAIKIAVLNESTVVTDAQVQAAVDALQIQVKRDFAPVWDRTAQLNFHPSKVPPSDAWQLVVLDDSDQADALGYHELTAAGLPLGKCFAASDIQAGTSWTVTLSHELLEMIVDPFCNEVAESDNADGSITFYAHEVGDAVEADILGYTIDGVLVSDFVLPSWFVPGEGSTVDFMRRISKPFQIAPGGYIGVLNTSRDSTWTQITANRRPGGPVAPRGSRRWRRHLPDGMWRKSKK